MIYRILLPILLVLSPVLHAVTCSPDSTSMGAIVGLVHECGYGFGGGISFQPFKNVSLVRPFIGCQVLVSDSSIVNWDWTILSDSSFVSRTTTDANGEYCIMVRPGVYTISFVMVGAATESIDNVEVPELGSTISAESLWIEATQVYARLEPRSVGSCMQVHASNESE